MLATSNQFRPGPPVPWDSAEKRAELDENEVNILRGEQFIDAIPTRLRSAMLDKHITRLVKSENGGAEFEMILNIQKFENRLISELPQQNS